MRKPQNLIKFPTWFWNLLVTSKQSAIFFQIFVAFSEYLNFREIESRARNAGANLGTVDRKLMLELQTGFKKSFSPGLVPSWICPSLFVPSRQSSANRSIRFDSMDSLDIYLWKAGMIKFISNFKFQVTYFKFQADFNLGSAMLQYVA